MFAFFRAQPNITRIEEKIDLLSIDVKANGEKIGVLEDSIYGLSGRMADIETVISGWIFSHGWSGRFSAVLADHFDHTELLELCLWFDIDLASISGDNHKEKVINVARYFQRRNKQKDLLDYCLRERPEVDWPIPKQERGSNG